MIAPPPWEAHARRALPTASSGTFKDVFWTMMRTYTGYSYEDLQALMNAGATLSSGISLWLCDAHGVGCPPIPDLLTAERTFAPLAPIEELPPVDFAENSSAVMWLRSCCVKYKESVSELLSVVNDCRGLGSRPPLDMRDKLRGAILKERTFRMKEDELQACFYDLRVVGKGLKQLTPDLVKFVNLTTLVLSNNPHLTSIAYMPPTCRVLIACGCSIQEVGPSNTLVFLGLAYNCIEALGFLADLPLLRVLDLTCNSVWNFGTTVDALNAHPCLEDVAFLGCPLSLLDGYTTRMTRSCYRLQHLDRVPLTQATRPQTVIAASPSSDGRCAVTVVTDQAYSVSYEEPTSIEVSFTLVRLEGLSQLTHEPLLREEHPLSDLYDHKGSKGKKKSKLVPLGPAYECSSFLSLEGTWGIAGGVPIKCEDIQLVANAAAAQQGGSARRKTLVTPPVDDVIEINQKINVKLEPKAEQAKALAQPLLLALHLKDVIRLPSGNSKTLTCDIGSFVADCSSLVCSAESMPRRATVQVPLVVSEAALEEKRIRARAYGKKADSTFDHYAMASSLTEVNMSVTTNFNSKRRSKSSFVERASGSCRQVAELKRLREEAEELRLIGNVEQRRAEELKTLFITLTLEFSIGSLPVLDQAPATLSKLNRRRTGNRAKH